MDSLPDEVAELVDRQKIYHVLTSYCRALDRCDAELMQQVYWEDGYDDHGVFAGNAQAFAEFIIKGIQDWFEVTQHTIANVHMEFEAGRSVAHTESYLFAYHKVKGTEEKVRGWFGDAYFEAHADAVRAGQDQDFIFGGRYVDRFEKRDGVWRIARRTVVMDWNINQPRSDIFDEGLFKTIQIHGARGQSDPVYQR